MTWKPPKLTEEQARYITQSIELKRDLWGMAWRYGFLVGLAAGFLIGLLTKPAILWLITVI